jgi:hypothetical protein
MGQHLRKGYLSFLSESDKSSCDLTPKLSGAPQQCDWQFIHGASAQTKVRRHLGSPSNCVVAIVNPTAIRTKNASMNMNCHRRIATPCVV